MIKHTGIRTAFFSTIFSLLAVSAPAFAEAVDGSALTIATVEGLSRPEAVRYDPELDVFFVANFNGDSAGDANGFVSKVSADGEILELKFMQGSERWPFHGGRGMYVDGRGLWVLDAGGAHFFDRRSGEQLDFVDFSAFDLGFLNDIVMANDGALYVTDTGTDSLYRMSDGSVSLAAKTPISANGIALNPDNGRLLLMPWRGVLEFFEWDVESGEFTSIGKAEGGGNFDGVEFVEGRILSASQEDSSLHLMTDGVDRQFITLPGRPADIGIDTKRKRVAVPYVALDRVDILLLDDS